MSEQTNEPVFCEHSGVIITTPTMLAAIRISERDATIKELTEKLAAFEKNAKGEE